MWGGNVSIRYEGCKYCDQSDIQARNNIFVLYAVKRPIIRATPTVGDLLLVPIYRSFATTCHNSKFVIFQENLLKVLKCYNFLWVQRRHSCSPAASFANCFMILYLLKVHLQTFLSTPITRKCQILSCDTLVANERYVSSYCVMTWWWPEFRVETSCHINKTTNK
jgi:hypothetical protein